MLRQQLCRYLITDHIIYIPYYVLAEGRLCCEYADGLLYKLFRSGS